MSLGKENKYEIRQRALLEAIRFCGGVAAYSRKLKIRRTRASNWCNHPEIVIPYEYAILTEDITQVSIDRLSPFTEAANKVIRRLRAKDKPLPINMELNEILIGNPPYLKWCNQNRPIIVGTDGVLISGLMQLEKLKASGATKTQVMVLDLEALLLENRSLMDRNLNLLISEQVAIGLRMEQLLGNQQEQRNELRNLKGEVAESNNTQLYGKSDEVQIEKIERIAHIIGLPNKDAYYCSKQVYLHGSSELINRIDQQKISIAMAVKILAITNDRPLDCIQTKT